MNDVLQCKIIMTLHFRSLSHVMVSYQIYNSLRYIYFLLFQEKVIARKLLFPVLDRVQLIDAGSEVGRIATEGYVEALEERVHPRDQGLRRESVCLY